MSASSQGRSMRADLPFILLLAVLQGWALYGLHHSIESHHWPATQPQWLLGLYALLVLIPLSLQLLFEHARKPALWVLVACLSALVFYFGWHHGSAVADPRADGFLRDGDCFPLGFILLVWWLHLLPFLQTRLVAGRWTGNYALLFAHAWRNIIGLAEAAVFTGLFWLILGLWQELFHMIGFDYFRDLFGEPIFVYPVTAVTVGCALHLIGSIDRLVSAVLEQILNLFKWLGTVAGVLLALFAVALIIKWPSLVFTGHRAIGAAWLLWLVAIMVLLLNAAFRNGAVEQPYPRQIATGLRFCIPLMMVVAITALYALVVRTQHYGLTVERVWAFVVAGETLIYSVGYSVAAARKGPWMAGIAGVNVTVAIALLLVMGLALTPVLSPYRLAANSQFHLALAGRYEPPQGAYGLTASPYGYLRFDAGEYGRRRLAELATLREGPDAERIRGLAAQAIARKTRWESPPVLDAAARVARLTIYPRGHQIEPDLAKTLQADWVNSEFSPYLMSNAGKSAAGVFADLDGDGVEEFILLTEAGGPVYRLHEGHWQRVADARQRRTRARSDRVPVAKGWEVLSADLAKGEFAVVPSQWKDLIIGAQAYRID
ncbi:MAG TPA: hypothetical protein VMT29_11730 [Steroidobacteraceae bacterium]|nr:hypothetical protein [Steroidobacteraceae bacterium]